MTSSIVGEKQNVFWKISTFCTIQKSYGYKKYYLRHSRTEFKLKTAYLITTGNSL